MSHSSFCQFSRGCTLLISSFISSSDEAAQATEPEILCPISCVVDPHLGGRKVEICLIGDPRQLSPRVFASNVSGEEVDGGSTAFATSCETGGCGLGGGAFTTGCNDSCTASTI